MTIKQLTEIVNGSLRPSDKQVDADLIEISSIEGNALETTEDGLLVNISQFPTKTEVTEAIEQAEFRLNNKAEWTLTNASISNGVLTYNGGTISGGNSGLHAEKTINVGESITIDFEVNLSKITSLIFSVDDGSAITDRYGDNAAVIFQDLTSAILIAQRDWLSEYKAYLQDITTYKASINRLSTDRVLLSVSDLSGTVLISRDITISGFDLKRAWFSVNFYNTEAIYTNTINVVKPVYALKSDVKEYEVRDTEGSVTTTDTQVDEFGKVIYTLSTKNVIDQMNNRPDSTLNTVKVESIPLYSLDSTGEYVLTTPDSWVSFNESNYLFPVYHLSTVSNDYAKGIVNFQIEVNGNVLRVTYDHTVRTVINDYSLDVSLLRLSNRELPHEFASSLNGEVVYGMFDIPLETQSDGESAQSILDSLYLSGREIIFEFSLKSEGKSTVITKYKLQYTFD